MNVRSFFAAAVLAALGGCGSVPNDPTLGTAPSTAEALTVPAEALNPDVRNETIRQTICAPGYAAAVRPSTTYTNGVKAKLLREQGMPATAAADYELDHRIPLALGGHPRHLSNLMLQPWEGQEGAKKKDRLERKLQSLVCSGRLSLDLARREIYLDWPATYRRYIGQM